jgi:hypothetical protein
MIITEIVLLQRMGDKKIPPQGYQDLKMKGWNGKV